MGFFSSLAWIILTFLFFTVMVAVISSLKTKEDNLDTAEGYFPGKPQSPPVLSLPVSLLLTNLSAEQLVRLNPTFLGGPCEPSFGWKPCISGSSTLLIPK